MSGERLRKTMQKLAEGAYHAYGSVTDFKNYQGLPMPEWDQLPPKIQEAWRAACLYVLDTTGDIHQDDK